MHDKINKQSIDFAIFNGTGSWLGVLFAEGALMLVVDFPLAMWTWKALASIGTSSSWAGEIKLIMELFPRICQKHFRNFEYFIKLFNLSTLFNR